MGEPSVQFADVSYAVPGGRTLLEGISFALQPATTTALLGRSGSGKTTILRMVNGLVQPTAGHVRTTGVEVGVAGVAELLRLRRSTGYVIQETGLFPHLSVERNAAMALELSGVGRAERTERVFASLRLAGLDPEEVAGRLPWQLSGGQRQRVGLARALAPDPQVLLLDEPFGALDPITRAELQTTLRELLGRLRKTALLVTHDLDEALYLADRVIFLEGGAIVADLPARKVLTSEIPAVRAYVRAVHRAGAEA